MPNDQDGVSIPINSSFDSTGTDAAAKALQTIQQAEQAASRPVVVPVATTGAEQVQAKLRDLSHDADKFIESIKLGAGLDVGGRIVEGLAEITARFREAIEEGVEFDKKLETLGIGLAAALAQTQPEKFGDDFNAALQTSGQLLDIVRAKALELNLGTTDLAHTLSVSMVGLVEGGIKDLNAQVETTGLLMQAAAAKGLTGFTALRDVIAILSGRANRVQLGRELGISDDDVKRAKEAGNLAEYLTGKLGAYREAAKVTGESLAGLETRFQNLTDALKGDLATPVFDALKDAYRELDEELSKPDVADALRSVGFEVAAVVRTGAGLLTFATQNAGALRLLAGGTAAYGAAMAATKISEFVLALGTKVLGLQAATASTARDAVVEGENTVQTEANTRARLRNAEAARAQAGAVSSGGAGGGIASVGGSVSAISLGVGAGTALNVLIQEIAANLDASTAKSKALGDQFEKTASALTAEIRNAKTAAEQDAARLDVQRQLVDFSLRLSKASGEEADWLRQQVASIKTKLDHFGQMVGTAVEVEAKQKAITDEEAKQQQIQEAIAQTGKSVATTEERIATARRTGSPTAIVAALERQRDAQQQNLDTLRASLPIQEALVVAAKARATTETGVTEALKAAGKELDTQTLADASKAEAAHAYAAALDEVVRRISQDTGLREDVVRAIRTGNDAEAAGLTISKQKQAVLAGYLPSLTDARNASDKANDAAAKEADTLKTKLDGLRDTLGTSNDKLADLRTKLLEAQNSTGADKYQKMEKILGDIKGVEDLRKQVNQEIKDIIDKQNKALEDAHPKETARIKELQAERDGLGVTGEHSDRKDQIDREIRQNQQAMSGQAPAAVTSPAHDLADTSTPYSQGGSADDPSPPVDRNPDGTRVGDAAADTVTAATNTDKAATDTSVAAQKLSTASGKLSDATSGLAPALDNVGKGFDSYHLTNLQGIQGILSVIDQSTTTLESQQGITEKLSYRLGQLEIRVGNLANDV